MPAAARRPHLEVACNSDTRNTCSELRFTIQHLRLLLPEVQLLLQPTHMKSLENS